MRILFSVSIIVIGALTTWLGFIARYEVNFIMVIIGLFISYIGYKILRRKKSKKTHSNHTYLSAKDDPHLTRFYNKNCHKCGQTSRHEIARLSRNSTRAYVTCSACDYWKEESW